MRCCFLELPRVATHGSCSRTGAAARVVEIKINYMILRCYDCSRDGG